MTIKNNLKQKCFFGSMMPSRQLTLQITENEAFSLSKFGAKFGIYGFVLSIVISIIIFIGSFIIIFKLVGNEKIPNSDV